MTTMTSRGEIMCSVGLNGSLEQLLLDANCTDLLPIQYRGLKLHYHTDIWTAAVIPRLVMLTVIMLMTFVGNIAIILVLTCSRYRKLNSRVNIFIVNLAIGDLSVFLFTMTTELLFVVFRGAWVVGAVACKILLYAQIVTLASTTFILAAMSFDRFMAICRPLSFGSTASRARKMIAVSWLMAFIFASPQLLIFKQKAVGVYPDGEIVYKCQSRGYTAWWQRKLYFTFMTSYILVIPAIFISFCYINVVKVVWRQGTESDSKEGISLRKSVGDKKAIPRAKIKTIKMTLSIICSFIACWTPYFVVHLIHIWSEYTYDIPEAVYAFAETMALLNSAFNPILYGCFNIKMKRGLTDLFCPNRTRDGNKFKPVSTNVRSQVRNTVSSRVVRPNTADNKVTVQAEQNSSSENESKDLVKSRSKDNIIKEENLNGFRLRVRFTNSKSPMQLRNLLGEGRSDSDCEDSHV